MVKSIIVDPMTFKQTIQEKFEKKILKSEPILNLEDIYNTSINSSITGSHLEVFFKSTCSYQFCKMYRKTRARVSFSIKLQPEHC